MRIFQPERALISREIREENRRELARILDQISKGRTSCLPTPSLEARFQMSLGKMREAVQRAKDDQTAHILRWNQS